MLSQRRRLTSLSGILAGSIALLFAWPAPAAAPVLRTNAQRASSAGATGTSLASVPLPLCSSPVVRPPQSVCASETTLVTAWFPLGDSSKHRREEYLGWMRNFLGSASAPVVVFTSPDARRDVEALRGALPLRVVLRDDVWALPWVAPRIEEYVSRQSALDPDAASHSPALYAIWNAKASLVAEAIADNIFSSSIFLWVDAGSFRETAFSDWPDAVRLRRIFAPRPCRMLFQLAAPLQPTANASLPWRGLVIAGTFFGGAAPAWRWFTKAYAAAHDAWALRGEFVGNDQNNLNVVVQRNLRRVMLLDTRDLPDACGPFVSVGGMAGGGGDGG